MWLPVTSLAFHGGTLELQSIRSEDHRIEGSLILYIPKHIKTQKQLFSLKKPKCPCLVFELHDLTSLTWQLWGNARCLHCRILESSICVHLRFLMQWLGHNISQDNPLPHPFFNSFIQQIFGSLLCAKQCNKFWECKNFRQK